MSKQLTIAELMRILHEAAGEGEDVTIDGDILDAEFSELGYDSIALLETGARIERQFGVTLDDDTVTLAGTPRVLLTVVNQSLSHVA